MTETPYYPHYVGDYQQKTKHLSMMEHGAYRLLLDHYYATKMPLPNEPAKLYRICGARSPSERKAVLSVATEFFTADDSILRHERCDSEIAKIQKYSETQSAKAKLRHSHGTAGPKPQQNSGYDAKNSRSEQHDFGFKSSRPDEGNPLNNQEADSAVALPRARNQNQNQKDNLTTTCNTSSPGDFEKIYDHGVKLFPQLVEKYSAVIRDWLEGGGVVKDIIGEFEKSRGKSPGSWEYFDKAVRRAMKARSEAQESTPHAPWPEDFKRWWAKSNSAEHADWFKLKRELGQEKAIEQTLEKWKRGEG